MTERDDSESAVERVRSVAVHREDVATALEATLRTDRRVVLRMTPPFAGRMRGRIHEVGEREQAAGPGEEDGAAVHLDPRDLVAEPPPYPEVDDTAAAHPDADLEERRERHAAAVDEWRAAVRESVSDTVTVTVDGAAHEIRVVPLG
ncbi:hypothetical protein JCM17823_00260 [Halorubrum gandharaense]